jgi:hypothetical protein
VVEIGSGASVPIQAEKEVAPRRGKVRDDSVRRLLG